MAFKCPRCVQTVHGNEDACIHCGYSLAVPDAAMGADPVLLDHVTDAARVLEAEAVTRIEKVLEQFECRFPQLFAAAYFGALPAQTNLRQFGFWLLNRAAVDTVDVSRPNENGLLVVVDTSGRSVAVVAGYFLECYLEEAAVTAALNEARPAFGKNDWAGAVECIMKSLTATLAEAAGKAAREPAKFRPAPAPAALPADLVRLREAVPPAAPAEPPAQLRIQSTYHPAPVPASSTPAAPPVTRPETIRARKRRPRAGNRR